MPAINVARTDTFEIQRQKINQIGTQIFNISAGGSDLSTGNLRLGDGTVSAPSLSFTNDTGVGIYRPAAGTLGYVNAGKKLLDLELDNIVFFKDYTVRQKILYDGGLSILNAGQNYDPGSYLNIGLNGGIGSNATADITVVEFLGSITQNGTGYVPGSYTGVALTGGAGSGATVDFNIDGISGTITEGSGYAPGTYNGVALTGGSGSNATANITTTGQVSFGGSISAPGSGYTDGVNQSVEVLNNPTTTYAVTVAGAPGSYQYVIDGSAQQALTLTVGNTYKFDLSDTSNVGHPFRIENEFFAEINPADNPGLTLIKKGSEGSAGAYALLVIKSTTNTSMVLSYDCSVHSGMGAGITLTSGSAGVEGTGGFADVTISGGVVTAFNLTTAGQDYKQGDIVTVDASDVGGTGSGFTYTLGAPTNNAVVSSVVIVNTGTGYLKDDVLSAATADIGGTGSGFQYTITSDPNLIDEVIFTDKGSGYAANDVLTLPTGVSGVSTTLNGQILNISTTLSTSSAQITVASTAGIVAGMLVNNGQSDIGVLAQNTTVQSVDSATQLTLSANPTVSGTASLSFLSSGTFNEISVTSTTGINIGDLVTQTAGTGVLGSDVTVNAIDDSTNTITLSADPTSPGTATLTFSPAFGSGTTPLQYTISSVGSIDTLSINSPGNGYAAGDQLSVTAFDLTQPITYTVSRSDVANVVFTTTPASSAFAVGDTIQEAGTSQGSSGTVVSITTSGGNITSMLITGATFAASDTVENAANTGVTFTVSSFTDLGNKIFIDTGSGAVITPSLTLYVGNIYTFDLSDSSNADLQFALSKFVGGAWGASLFEGLTTTLDVSSDQVTVSSTTGIQVGMSVETETQSGGILLSGTTVAEVIDATTLRLSVAPSLSGAASLRIRGVEYTDAVTSDSTSLTLKVLANTPTLYYYNKDLSDTQYANEGGEQGSEATFTMDANNPKTFGSGFVLNVLNTQTNDVVTADIETGTLTASKLVSTTDVEAVNIVATADIQGSSLRAPSVVTDQISSSTSISFTTPTTTFNSNVNIGANVSVVQGSGNITTSGYLKTTGYLNVDDKILIDENQIQTTTGNDLELAPVAGRILKVTGTQAIVIPVGNTSERPGATTRQNGAIRFNTDSNQYEGYNATTTSWSSLGGVRDIDGNTYILAELTAGANDNTLWFYNDGNNTAKLTTEFFNFNTVKKISSEKLGLPNYTVWAANTSVTVGQYLKHRNNLYEVTGAGTTASTGNEPTHTSGAQNNGTAQLTWSQIAVAPLEFTELEELRVGPNNDCPLIVSSELKLLNNEISTIVGDLILRPNAGKTTKVESTTHFKIPAGTENEKQTAAAGPGSIRFNTDIQQFEGYSGSNWSSLGGVRDVDGNTYIIPETAPAANENILYFYNNNSNTLQLSATALDFTNIDTITTSGGNSLAIDTQVVTLNSNNTTIDNTDSTSTFISTTKQYLDLGLSSGLNVDPVLRLDNQGDVYLNTTFGTGSFNGVKIFDGDLKEFELADYKISSSTFVLDKGGLESSSVVLYPSGTSKGCKVTVVSKSSSGKRSMSEYSVIDNGTDIFHNEFASLNTSADQYTATFDFTASTEPRITLTLTNDHAVADIINFTVLVQEIK